MADTSSCDFDWSALVMKEDPPPIKEVMYEFSGGKKFSGRTESSGAFAEEEEE